MRGLPVQGLPPESGDGADRPDASSDAVDGGGVAADAEADGPLPLVCGSQDPAAENLVACFNFEDSLADEVGLAPQTQQNGSPAFVDGPYGRALDLGGTDSVFTAGSAIYESDVVTISLWVRPRTRSIERIGLVDLEERLGLFISPDTGIRCNGQFGDVTRTNIPLNAWTHVACRQSPTGGAEIFKNGQQRGCDRGEPTPDPAVPFPLYMGANGPSGGQELIGSIDSVRFHTRALSDLEMCAAAGRDSCPAALENCE